MDKHLHIVTHDIPWPVNHGGFADLYYKILTLHKEGFTIQLHCFHKPGRKPEPHLEQYCASVKYYERTNDFTFRLPYIVSSRKNKELDSDLLKDDFPVILEGIHCSYPAYAGILTNRKVVIRLHNIEHLYYGNLTTQERNVIRKIYFRVESYLLKKYENAIAKKVMHLAVAENDAAVYGKLFGGKCDFLPVFIPWQNIQIKNGSGDYCLYHGNLSVSENNQVAKWLINGVFKNSKYKLVIAGLNPPQWLQNIAQEESVKLVINPSESELQALISNAHINIIPSLNNTGVKLKLLNALFNGRHCLTNSAGATGSAVERFCVIAESSSEFSLNIESLMAIPFTEEMISDRKSLLQVYDNRLTAARLMTYL